MTGARRQLLTGQQPVPLGLRPAPPSHGCRGMRRRRPEVAPSLVRVVRVVLVAASALSAVLSGAAGAEAAARDRATWPPPLPATRLAADGVCTVSEEPLSPASSGQPVGVATGPVAVAVAWLPGLNDRRCAAVRVLGGRATARRLAADVDAAPIVSGGLSGYHCPADDGTAAGLAFRDRGGRIQAVVVKLSGCGWVLQSGRRPRWRTARLDHDLARLAPPAWRPYLNDPPGAGQGGSA